MVQVLPQFDPGAAIGAQFGQGLNQVLQMFGKAKMRQNALQELENLTTADLQGMSMPQRYAALMKPFTLPGSEALGAEVVPQVLKIMGEIAEVPTAKGAPEVELGQADAAVAAPQPKPQVPTPSPSASVKPEVDQEPLTDPQANAGTPELVQERFDSILAFPEYKAMALRGNPQGLSFDEQQTLESDLVRKGLVNRDVAKARVKDWSNYLREKHAIVQDLNNQVSQEAAGIYGESPFYDLMEQVMLRETGKQIDQGLLEPNSVRNVARRKAKDVERIINSAVTQKGRPLFEAGVKDRKKEAANWVADIAKDDPYVAAELLQKDQIPVADGRQVPGPDWGPVRATEIALKAGNHKAALQNYKKLHKELPEIVRGMTVPMGGKLGEELAQRRAKAKESGIQMLTNYLVNMDPNDSVVLARYAAKSKGYDESEFNTALEQARQLRDGREFSPSQNREIGVYLANDVRPSPFEIFMGFRSLSDLITGKL